MSKASRDAKAIFLAAVQAASPGPAVKSSLKLYRNGHLKIKDLSLDLNKIKNIYVIGAGKAACGMAEAVEETLGHRISGGVTVTKYGHSRRLTRMEVIEAGHPIPDGNGLLGAQTAMEIAGKAGRDDLVLCLISGGASALLPLPFTPLTLEDKREVTSLLINSGAAIEEINAVRKHLSAIKGGGLARAAWPARVITLIISDVVGDDASSIASGPTAPDPSTYRESLAIIKKYGLKDKVPPAVARHLEKGVKGRLEETPKPGDPVFKRCANFIIANNSLALAAAKAKAKSLGYDALILTSSLKGNTHEAARFFTAILKEAERSGNPVRPPACVLMGGETTLTVKGKGLGGRNQEFALLCALELEGTGCITVLAAGTDGTDGPTDAAGAMADSATAQKARKAGTDPAVYLSRNDSHNFFRQTCGLIVTGPTGTNVMDIAVGIVTRAKKRGGIFMPPRS